MADSLIQGVTASLHSERYTDESRNYALVHFSKAARSTCMMHHTLVVVGDGGAGIAAALILFDTGAGGSFVVALPRDRLFQILFPPPYS